MESRNDYEMNGPLASFAPPMQTTDGDDDDATAPTDPNDADDSSHRLGQSLAGGVSGGKPAPAKPTNATKTPSQLKHHHHHHHHQQQQQQQPNSNQNSNADDLIDCDHEQSSSITTLTINPTSTATETNSNSPDEQLDGADLLIDDLQLAPARANSPPRNHLRHGDANNDKLHLSSSPPPTSPTKMLNTTTTTTTPPHGLDHHELDPRTSPSGDLLLDNDENNSTGPQQAEQQRQQRDSLGQLSAERRVQRCSSSYSGLIVRKFQKFSSSALSSAPSPDVKIGQRVAFKEYYGNEFGTIRWIGRVPQISPDWTVGVEFDNAIGEGDGSLNGRRYFIAKDCFAKFLPLARVNLVDQHVGRPEPGTMISVMSATVRPGQMISIQRVSTVHVQHCFLNAPHRKPGAEFLAVNTRLHCQCPNCGPCAHVVKPPRTQRTLMTPKNATHMCQFSTYTCCGMESSDEALCTYTGNKISSLPPPPMAAYGSTLPPIGNSWMEGSGYLSQLQAEQRKLMPEEYRLGAAPEDVSGFRQAGGSLRRSSSSRRRRQKTSPEGDQTRQDCDKSPLSMVVSSGGCGGAAADERPRHSSHKHHHKHHEHHHKSRQQPVYANVGTAGEVASASPAPSPIDMQSARRPTRGVKEDSEGGEARKWSPARDLNQDPSSQSETQTQTAGLLVDLNDDDGGDNDNDPDPDLELGLESMRTGDDVAATTRAVQYRDSIENRYLFPTDDVIDSTLEADLETLSQARYGRLPGGGGGGASSRGGGRSSPSQCSSWADSRHCHRSHRHRQGHGPSSSSLGRRSMILKSLRSLVVSCLSANESTLGSTTNNCAQHKSNTSSHRRHSPTVQGEVETDALDPGKQHSESCCCRHLHLHHRHNQDASTLDGQLEALEVAAQQHQNSKSSPAAFFGCSAAAAANVGREQIAAAANGYYMNLGHLELMGAHFGAHHQDQLLLDEFNTKRSECVDALEFCQLDSEKLKIVAQAKQASPCSNQRQAAIGRAADCKHNHNESHPHPQLQQQQQPPPPPPPTRGRQISSSSDCGFSSASQNSMNLTNCSYPSCSPTATTNFKPDHLGLSSEPTPNEEEEEELQLSQIYKRLASKLAAAATTSNGQHSGAAASQDDLLRLKRALIEIHSEGCCLHHNCPHQQHSVEPNHQRPQKVGDSFDSGAQLSNGCSSSGASGGGGDGGGGGGGTKSSETTTPQGLDDEHEPQDQFQAQPASDRQSQLTRAFELKLTLSINPNPTCSGAPATSPAPSAQVTSLMRAASSDLSNSL